MYAFNLLVSCSWGTYKKAREEIKHILRILGYEEPLVTHTLAQGTIGVKTRLNSREVIRGLRRLYREDPWVLQYTLKWVQVYQWTYSDMESMKAAVADLGKKIQAGERWRMTVKKRRYDRYHKIEIIKELAELVDRKVELENRDKILRIEIIGKYAGMSLLGPYDVFSAAKLLS